MSKDKIIQFLTNCGLAYICGSLAIVGYKQQRIKYFSRFEDNVDLMNEKEKTEYLKLKEYQDNHFGNKILQSVYAQQYLHGNLLTKIAEINDEIALSSRKMHKTKDPFEVEKLKSEINELQLKVANLEEVAKGIDRSKYFDREAMAAKLQK